MLMYLKDGSAQTVVCAVTLRSKLQIKLAISPSHSILTPGQPVWNLRNHAIVKWHEVAETFCNG